MDIHKIYEHNLTGLQFKLDKLNRRALKLGLDPITLTVVGQEDQSVKDVNGYPTGRVRRVLHVTCEGVTPKIAGWSLVGVIEPVSDGEKVVGNQTRAVPGQSVPEQYRHASMLCDHCQTERNRREVFIVRHESGAFKQVGRQCLVDFLGGADPQALVAAAGLLRSFEAALGEADEEYESGGGRGESRYGLLEFLARTSKIIRDNGWMPRSKALADGPLPTVVIVENSYGPKAGEWFTPPVEGDEDYVRAADTLAWLESLAPDDQRDDYLYNLSLLAGTESIRPKQTGLAASAIAAFMRHLGREIERKQRAEVAAKSEWFGEVKKRETFTLTLQFTRLIPSDYGETILHRFVDASGNIATWFSSKGEICGIGETVTVKATVKGHEEYKGAKQTMLTRLETAEDAEFKKGAKARQRVMMRLDENQSHYAALPYWHKDGEGKTVHTATLTTPEPETREWYLGGMRLLRDFEMAQ